MRNECANIDCAQIDKKICMKFFSLWNLKKECYGSPVFINGNEFNNGFYGSAVQYAAGVKLRVTDRFSVDIGGRVEHESRVNSARVSLNMNYSF